MHKSRNFASSRLACQLLGSAAFGALLVCSGQASAQTAAEEVAEEEAIVVTGTSIRGVAPVGSATVSVSAETLKEEGLSRAADLTRILPQLQSSPIRETSADGIATNSTRGQAFNLRGLGNGGTLLLIDGHRTVPNGAADSFSDANVIPLAAISRVEVVTDGASAIYGADAVGGVVNYILRRDYEGLQVRTQYSEILEAQAWEGSFVAGKNYSYRGRDGNLMVAGRHSHRDPVMRSQSPYLNNVDLTGLGGLNSRVNGTTVNSGRPGTVAVNLGGGVFNYYALPANSTGVGLTAADLTPGLGNMVTLADANDYPYLGEETHDSATFYWNQEITDDLSIYASGYWNHRSTENYLPTYATFTVPDTNPNFIAGLGATSQVVNYRFPDTHINSSEETKSLTVGGRLDMAGDWQAELYTTYGQNASCGFCRPDTANSNSYQALFNSGAFNPYRTLPPTTSQLANIQGADIDSSDGSISDTMLKLDGPLFSMPGGEVRAAVGVEHTRTTGHYANSNTNSQDGTNTLFFPRPPVSLARTVDSAFMEIYVPLVGSDNSMPMVHSLSLSGAVRYDDYSDFGDTTNPKIGVTWEPTQDLRFRGTWGKSFRAPTLQQANAGTIGNSFFIPFFTNGSGDPAIPTQGGAFPGATMTMLMAGGNANLGPETAETYSFGFDYAPPWFEGFSASVTYYSVDYTDRIQGLPANQFLATPANRALYSQFIQVAPQPATCVEGDFSTYHPAYNAAIAEDPYVNLFGGLIDGLHCLSVAVLDGRIQNIGIVQQDGIDFNAQYDRDIGVGRFNAGVSVTKILTLEQQLILNAPLSDVLDTLNNANSLRIRGNVGFTTGGLRLGLFVNHVGEYRNTAPLVGQPVRTIPSWTTYDAAIGYTFEDETSPVGGFAINLNVQNFTDEDPPLVLTGNLAFDERNANPFGRIVQIELVKTF